MKSKTMKFALMFAMTAAALGVYAGDPTIDALKAAARRQRARYAVIKRTTQRYDPAKTNMFVRPMRASLAERIAEARAGWSNALVRAQANWAMYTNAATRAEAVIDLLTAKRAEYVEKRDKAALPTTKAIYQAFIDQIDQWLRKLEPKKEDE